MRRQIGKPTGQKDDHSNNDEAEDGRMKREKSAPAQYPDPFHEDGPEKRTEHGTGAAEQHHDEELHCDVHVKNNRGLDVPQPVGVDGTEGPRKGRADGPGRHFVARGRDTAVRGSLLIVPDGAASVAKTTATQPVRESDYGGQDAESQPKKKVIDFGGPRRGRWGVR